MSDTTLDHARLARALQSARVARRWRQDDVVERGKALGFGEILSRATVQRYERGEPFKQIARVRRTLRAFDMVYDWAPGSTETVLLGGEPTPMSASLGATEAPSDTVQPPTPHSDTTSTTSSSSLPVGVQAALDDGETFATDVIEFPDLRLIVVVKAGSYATEEGRQGLKEAMREWLRVQKGIRNLVPRSDDPSDERSNK